MTTYRIGVRTSRDEQLYTVLFGERVLATYEDHDDAVEHIHLARQNDADLIEQTSRAVARVDRGMSPNADAIPVIAQTSRLTDGSEVHDVIVNGAVFHCVTEEDARRFLECFRILVGRHTLESLAVRHRTQL